MEKLHQFLTGAFAVIVGIAVLAGALVGALFVLALLIGGNAGEGIAKFNGAIMNTSKWVACVAILCGLIDFYIQKDHALKIDS